MNRQAMVAGVLLACSAAAAADSATLPVSAGTGPHPQLPPPVHSAIPTVSIAHAVGWPPGAQPEAASGLRVQAFAAGLNHPRWVYTLPNGDVLVAETDAPPKPDDAKGIKGWISQKIMRRAGSGGPSGNRILLLRDANGDGIAETRETFIEALNSPFGMVLVGKDLYVADTDALLRFPYQTGQTRITVDGQKVADLPAGTINHHWTKNVIASPDGKKLYVTVGSNSNVAENGIAAEQGRAAIWEIDAASGAHRVFASGLRNPNGMAWVPQNAGAPQLWTDVNERDELGSDLVPDYMTAVKDGGFYGWPYSYYGNHVDTRVEPARPDLVATARVPDYALGPHTASLGLCWSGDARGLTPAFANGLFVGQHGSWNRKPRSGYKVLFVPFEDGKPNGEPVDVLLGFLHGDEAYGRPVGVAMDGAGALLVADDVGNTVWRVSRAP